MKLTVCPILAASAVALTMFVLASCTDTPAPQPAQQSPVAPSATRTAAPPASSGKLVRGNRGMFVHKPFAQDDCRRCHDAAGNILASARDARACLECHDKLMAAKPVMHGPVIAGACIKCHAAHESPFAALLITDQQPLCTQCHDRGTLSRRSTGHLSSRRSCLECHVAHGAPNKHLLRPDFVSPLNRVSDAQ